MTSSYVLFQIYRSYCNVKRNQKKNAYEKIKIAPRKIENKKIHSQNKMLTEEDQLWTKANVHARTGTRWSTR